jgi:hypothetical protein
MKISKGERRLLWDLLFPLRNCFDDNGTLVDRYCENVILEDLTKWEKKMFDNLVNLKL